MPRTGAGNALWRKLTALSMFRIRSAGGSTTTTAAIVKGDGVANLTATTGFLDNDYMFINGSGGLELNQVDGTPAAAMPLEYTASLPQAIGATVVEAEELIIGKIAQGQTAIQMSRSLQAIFDDIGDTPLAYIESPIDLGLRLGLLEFTGKNFSLALGFADAEVGSGTAAVPYQTVIGEPNAALSGLTVFRAAGIRHDAQILQVDFLDAKFEASGDVPLGKEAPAIIPVTLKFTKMIIREWV